jgi:alpha-maltose-1-phosphate synthase
MKKIAIVRGKFLNAYEMQLYEPLSAKYNLTAFGSLRPYHDSFSFPVVHLPSPMDLPNFPYKMPLLNRVFTDAHVLFGLEYKLRGFDLVHSAETYFSYTQQALNAKKYGFVKKVIATVLENIPFNNEGISGRKAYKDRAIHELDHMIALTNLTKKTLIAEGADPGKISVIPHFIDTTRFAPASDWLERVGDSSQKNFTILFVGRLEEYKGIFDVLESFAMLVRDKDLYSHTLHLQFVGDGSMRRNLSDQIYAKGLDKHSSIKSATYLEMPEIYKQADIFVAPSKMQYGSLREKLRPTWIEQYGTMVLEAQSSGLPIVTTHSGGIPENVGNAAVLVPAGDVTGITRALKDFILSPHKRLLYAKRARNRAVTVHDIHRGAKKLDRLYETILSG